MAFTVQEVATATGLSPGAVQQRANHGWHIYVESRKPIMFRVIPPVSGAKPSTAAPAIPPELVGHLLPGGKPLALKSEIPEPADGSKLSWAAYWALRGLKVFPAESFTGTPLIGFTKFDSASSDLSQIQRWWTTTPDADIGVMPDDMGLFLVEVHRNCTQEPDLDLSGALIISESMLGDRRYWFPGRVFTRLHALGEWVHLIGIGEHSFLPPSLAGGLVQ